MKTVRSAGIVVVSGTKPTHEYLLLQHTDGHWDFPKGHMDDGENEKETALRELAEETAITDITIDPEFFANISYDYTYEGAVYAKTVRFFLGTTTSKDVTLSEEHQDYAWLSFESVIERVTFPNTKSVLQEAEQHLQTLESSGGFR